VTFLGPTAARPVQEPSQILFFEAPSPPEDRVVVKKRQSAHLLCGMSIIEEQDHLATRSQVSVMCRSIDAQERFTLRLGQ